MKEMMMRIVVKSANASLRLDQAPRGLTVFYGFKKKQQQKTPLKPNN